MSRVLVGVFTGNGPKYEARRDLCERTWVKGLRALGHCVKFIKTASLTYIYDRCEASTAYVTCDDGWDALPQKTRGFLRLVLMLPKWKWVAKVDDDSFVHPARFAAFLDALTPDMDYVGADVGTAQGYAPYASGGAGYVLSRRAAAIVAEQLTDRTGFEDKRVGEILRAAGIPFHHDPRFIPFGASMGVPRKDNNFITSHAISTEAWMDAWRQSQST